MSAGTASAEQAPVTGFRRSLWSRQLSHYPNTGPRTFYLGVTVLATIILYYEFYLQGAVATQIIQHYNMTFTYFVVISIVANGIGAFASLLAGFADRWGRANLVTYGLLITGVLYAFALPHAPTKVWFMVIYSCVGFVEGIVLVATPALIRDFSPQVGRGFAMGFWTLGPVLGSLVVTEVSSHTLTSHPDWRFQFYLCGGVGIAVFVIAFVGLRELSPRIRDQLMVTMRDRVLVEARAAGLKLEDLTKHLWRQMIRPSIFGPAFAISLFLLLYYIAAGFAVVYFATVYGYSESKANALANWYWITNAITLVVTGLLSDYAAGAQAVHGARHGDQPRRHRLLRHRRHQAHHQLLPPRGAVHRHRARRRHVLLRLDGGLHRDRREGQPGRHRHRPGLLGLDHPHRRHHRPAGPDLRGAVHLDPRGHPGQVPGPGGGALVAGRRHLLRASPRTPAIP